MSEPVPEKNLSPVAVDDEEKPRAGASGHDETQDGVAHPIDGDRSKVLANTDLMDAAVDGENREHAMTLWAAAKTHPWACLWAFTFCEFGALWLQSGAVRAVLTWNTYAGFTIVRACTAPIRHGIATAC